jgi:hypothetical protein
MPAGPVLLVAYFARHEATAVSVMLPSSVTWTMRGSTWAPHRMSQPFRLAGWATVANRAAEATWRIRSASTCGVDGRVWRDGPLGVVGVDAVEPEDGVEVDASAALELSHLGVRQSDARAVRPGDLV